MKLGNSAVPRPAGALARGLAAATLVSTTVAAAAPRGADAPPPRARRLGAIGLAIGPGSALCDRKEPEDACPVDGGFAFGIGGGYRLTPSWELGAELAFWSFSVRDSWRREVASSAADAEFSSFFFAPHARYWFLDRGALDPYLQIGFGLGTVSGSAEDGAGGRYEVENSGFAYPVAAGLDWYATDDLRLGLQGLGYVHATRTHCERENGAAEECSRGTSDHGAVAWRLVLVGSWVFGDR